MSTKILNLTATSTPIPGPNFYWARDPDGKCTGRHTFTIVRGALGNPTNQARFRKGVSIATLDPTLGAFFAFLTIDSFEAQDLPGGFTEVTVALSGYSEGGDFNFDDEVSYSSSNTMIEKSIIEHPDFLHDVSSPLERDCFCKAYNGLAIGKPSFGGEGGSLSSVAFYDNIETELLATITAAAYLKWYRLIFIEDHRTYLVPSFEWVKTTANQGGLSDDDVADLGKIFPNPPGNPPRPRYGESGFTWMKIGANDTRGESSAATEETWSWGYWPDEIYRYDSVD